MEIITIVSDINGKRIDAWLSEKLENYSRSFIQKLIQNENVKVNNNIVKANYKLKNGDAVAVSIPEPVKLEVKPEKIPLDILYEDDDIIVVNKSKSMVVHPAAETTQVPL